MSDPNQTNPENAGNDPKNNLKGGHQSSVPSGDDAEIDPADVSSSTSVTVVSGDSVQDSIDLAMEAKSRASVEPELVSPDAIQIVDSAEPHVQTQPAPRASEFHPVWEVLKLVLIPSVIIAAFLVAIMMLGLAQRVGWIDSGASGDESSMVGMTSAEESSAVSYICPMMCVPPTSKPGRCPVCAMELVPAASGSSSGPSSKIQIDARSRRIAGIQTSTAQSQTLYREVRGVGEISYDESRLKTLSAYIDGRIEELYADYTGIEVKKGDELAMLYSPELYSAQVEYVRTLEYSENSSTNNARVAGSNRQLLASSRARLIELGLTEKQVQDLETAKTADRRLALLAPMSGTVIEKMAATGQYVKAGMPIYRLADLTKVWLVLELFPEDASLIEIGQPVTALTLSNNGQTSEGKVEFVEPTVDPKMRTVGVRVSIDNPDGHLKPGEFARATLRIPLLSESGEAQPTVVVPRNSLLAVGPTSLVYVEGKPGEFQLRRVKTGPTVDGMIAILEGLSAGENVVSRSTFLLDAQMQLQGNPSLIDPDKAVALEPNEVELDAAALEEIRIAMEPLSESDRKLAEAQVICPVTEVRLGTLGMGTPIKLEIEGRTVFICCEGCRKMWNDKPEKYFKILDDYLAGKSSKPSTPSNENTAMPQMDLPQMDLPQMNIPKMELPK